MWNNTAAFKAGRGRSVAKVTGGILHIGVTAVWHM